MKKILWFILLIFVIYIVLIFVAPSTSDTIGKRLGILYFNEYIRSIKNNVQEFSTSELPTRQEFNDAYNKALSGAIELKDEIKGGADRVKEGVDTVREDLTGLENQYNDVKDTITDTKDKIGDSIDAIRSLTGTLENDILNINN